MSNAWFHYVAPLGVATAFVIAGIASLCAFVWGGGRNAEGKRKFRPSAIVGAVFCLGLGGALGLYILLNAPTPAERERLFDHFFRTPPERIERFIIKGGNPADQDKLTSTDVVIDDPARIRQIAEILRAATEQSSRRPRNRWTAEVEMVTCDGTYYFRVNRMVPGHPSGTQVAPLLKERACNLGDWRADGLDEVLEEAVNKARKPD
jgi:hypothetical protein